MKGTGGCYCGTVRFEVDADPVMEAQCHCRPCQYFTGGGPNYFAIVPEDGYRYTAGEVRAFARSDLEHPRIREFCPDCGTHMVTRLPGRPLVVVKVGTLDDPSIFAGPKLAIHCSEIAHFHTIPEGLPAFDTLPPRPGQ